MALIIDAQVEFALKCLQDWNAAKARAAHEFLDDLTKTVLAQICDLAPEDCRSQAAREDFARKHPDFMAHLEKKRDAAEHDFMHRQRLSASMAIIDLYRTDQASNRGADRLR